MSKKANEQQANPSVQYWQILRSFSIRYLAYLRQKSGQPQGIDELEISISRILNQNEGKQVALSKLLSLELRGDYHQVIALTLMQDLAKWSRQHHEHLSSHNQYQPLLQSITEHSAKLLNSQQQFHTIVPKQNDLLRELLITPHIITAHSLEGFRTFYRKLKDVKEFYPQTIKQHQKVVFLKTVEEAIEVCARLQAIKTYEFVFHNVFAELEVLEPSHEFVTSRLKLVKKILKNLWFFHPDIVYKSAFAVMKFSQQVLTLPHLFSSVLNLYEDLMPILVQNVSPAPLIIFNHLIINNLNKMIQQRTFSVLSLEILLNALTQIFKPPFIGYFMKNYDANFIQNSVCQSALNILFEFVQNRANQKKPEYQIFKRYLKKATDSIRAFLNTQQPHIKPPSQKLQKFYQVKKKEYMQIVQDMNQKPKKLFKKLESISNKQIREEIMKKYSRIAKHSSQLEMKKMIDLFAANNATSEELFGEYVSLLFSNLGKDVNLEEFLRFFSSNFFLNGESQQILRVLDKITVLFYNHQPPGSRILKTSDATYTFANAIILLNADLHNPQNEQKMSLQAFYKMCKKINAGDDLPTQILTQTYTNIKKNKINTFRQKSQMPGISPSNFVLICGKQQEHYLEFYDLEMRMLTDENFYDFWVFDLLAGIIDERETMKLEQLIERFVYDDNAYECEVIELVRKLAKKKPHVPLHALEKILEHANFKNSKTSEKTISYLWLAVNLIQTFSAYLPTNVICELLIFTWRMRSQIKDDMYSREKAEIRRIRKMVRQYQKGQSKKSIMDMFSSFLSSKQEDSQPDVIQEFSMSQTSIKKMNHKMLTEKVLEVLAKSSAGSHPSKSNHRVKAIQFFIGYLRNDEQKIFEEFLSLLYMIFHLLYKFEISPLKQANEGESVSEQWQRSGEQVSPKKKSNLLSSSLKLSTQLKLFESGSLVQFEETVEELFYELLGLKESSITKRIENLKKKDAKKYEILESYCHYWVLKILIGKISLTSKISVSQDHIADCRQPTKDSKQQNNQLYLLNKSVEYMQKTDREIFLDLVYEFQAKAKQAFSVSFQRNINAAKSISLVGNKGEDARENQVNNTEAETKVREENGLPEELVQTRSEEVILMRENWQEVGLVKNLSLTEPPNKQTQITESKLQDTAKNTNLQQITPSLQPPVSLHSPTVQQPQNSTQNQQEIIEAFIFNYRKLIIEFYANSLRVLGKEEIKKKEWRWLVELEKMIQQVMENYEEKMMHKKQGVQSANVKVKDASETYQKEQKTQSMLHNDSQTHLDQNQKQDILKAVPQPQAISQPSEQAIEQQAQPQPIKYEGQLQQDLVQRINRELSSDPLSSEIEQKVQETKPVQANQNEPVIQQKKIEQQPQVTLTNPGPKQQDKEIAEAIQASQKSETNLIKEQQQAIKKLMQMYPTGQSSQMLGMPFYML